MDEQRKYAILFAATTWQHGNSATPISSRGREPQPQTEAIQKADQILEQIEERYRMRQKSKPVKPCKTFVISLP